jgi:hypothetical protein
VDGPALFPRASVERDIKISANKNGPNVDEKMGNSQMQTKDCDIKDINNKQGAQTNYGTPFKVQ